MKEELISFETAKLAKEKGFDEISEICFTWDSKTRVNSTKVWKDNDDTKYLVLHPKFEMYQNTQSLLQKWLREEKDVQIDINSLASTTPRYSVGIWSFGNKDEIGELTRQFNTYEEALEEGLKEALGLLK